MVKKFADKNRILLLRMTIENYNIYCLHANNFSSTQLRRVTHQESVIGFFRVPSDRGAPLFNLSQREAEGERSRRVTHQESVSSRRVMP
jgi:hypothetical protein